ncbi:pilus assembly protein [Stenotrophomonas sp. Betaine-02u-21]|uniref:pilus assembly protein n=1 Tax=unclassified Stenotrophomonas TaxID=196198 RepID=UPI000C330099|nr:MULTISPECIES: PilC/PilY family type IV pilus protein [unclassified Stenotrophomonas]PKH71190.1 pilus assembly protein [Stenotrophomonas sp. Betaine-02u-23]PKH73211.1 pilus assembly protein [Stenotrophomonas sp. Betaine-02u-21]PKH95809.1 pilus assembly protein [Stenotrophomonas sp. Bg11-02]
MTRRTFRIAAASAAVVLGAGAYFAYSLFAAQGQGALAQAPLNNTTSIQPAFIMAVDDSNSMTFERIFQGGDGRMQWNGSSFFRSAGVFYDVGEGCANNSVDCYLYLFPHASFNTSYTPGRAIPPIDEFGFARSPAYNASYYNPDVKYDPWSLPEPPAAGIPALWPDAAFDRARADPRNPSVYGTDFSNDYNTIYNLAYREVNGESFQFMTGMTIPSGTRYRSNGRSCNSNNNNGNGLPSTGNAWTTLSSDVLVRANCTVQMAYVPATFYLPAAAPAPAGYKTADANRPVIANACGPGCNMRRYQILPDNYSDATARVAAQVNFANWFQYHRNRILSMVGSSSHAMAGVENMRVGYFTINNRVNVTMHDVSTQRANLFNQIYGLNPSGGTPNRQAAAFLGEQFRRTDAGAPVVRACQRNGGMLFTDGYTNSGNSAGGYGNADSAGGTHFPGAPFADNYSNTIADIAASYYGGASTPLRTGASFQTGLVPVPEECSTLSPSSAQWKRLDCQANLHMNFYGVTLGAQGLIYEVNQAATDDPYANPPNWNAGGDPLSGDDGRVIDELWHAAINSRGEFINAKTPGDVTDAMRRVLEAVGAAASPSGTLATSGARIGAGSLTVSPEYSVQKNGTDWFSRLTAARVTVNAAREAQFTPIWEASAQLPAAAARNVYFNDGSSVRKFGPTTVTLAGLCGLSSSLYPGQAICTTGGLTGLGATPTIAANYLLGDTANEVRRNGKLRDRTNALGDIINSTPVISAPTDDFGYRALGGTLASSYTAYLNSKRTSKRFMVYAGANDGMLHAFDGGMDGTGAVSGNGGRETFGYIPATSYGHMGNLLIPYDPAKVNAQQFSHRYFVDGPLTVADTYYNDTWNTTLVGSTGAGGRGVFALDVTTPGSFTATNRLWEINDLSGADAVKANIGHVLGKPVIVPVRTLNGGVSWKAIFGNGYSSSSGKAVLFVVDIGNAATPTIRMIEATESNSGIAGSNGLGNIIVLDRLDTANINASTGLPARVRDGYADTVYAADLKGAVWKFDLLSTANSVTVPVFTTSTFVQSGATYRQPITGGLQASAGESGGVLVMFGTGSFSFNDDTLPISSTQIQSLYGFNDTSNAAVTSTLTRTSLTPYTVAAGTGGRTLSRGTAPTSARGWYIDLPAGERAVGYPELASGILFIPTYTPDSITSGCTAGGGNNLFGLNPRTGGGALSGVRMGSISGATAVAGTASMALATGGTAPVKDVGVSVVPRLQPPANPGGGAPAPTPPGGSGCWMVVNVAGAPPMYVPYPCGRQSWRQIQ